MLLTTGLIIQLKGFKTNHKSLWNLIVTLNNVLYSPESYTAPSYDLWLRKQENFK